jgi:hypothetical protein
LKPRPVVLASTQPISVPEKIIVHLVESIDEVFVRPYSHAVHQSNGFGDASEADMFTLVEE